MGTPLVLIADDEAVVCDMLTDKLARAGFAVLVARNGQEALDLARTCAPALIVLDWVMPVVDGLTVCRQFKADPATAGIPVIMLTARGQDTERAAARAAGVDLLLVKHIRAFRGEVKHAAPLTA